MPSLSDIHSRVCQGSLTEKARAYDEDVRFLIDMINDLKRRNQSLEIDASKISRLDRLEKALASSGYFPPASAPIG